MDKRFLLTIILTFLVLFIWQLFFFKPPPPKEAQEKAVSPSQTTEETLSTKPGESAPVPSDTEKRKVSGGEVAPSVFGELPEGIPGVIVESPLFIAKITLKGGALSSFVLKKFQLSDGSPVQLIPEGRALFLASFGTLSDMGISYTASADTLKLSGSDIDTLVLEAITEMGTVKKRYIFDGSSYLFKVEIETPGPFSLVLSQGLLSTETNRKADIAKFRALFYTDHLKKYSLKSLKGKTISQTADDLSWVGVKSKYFLLAAIKESSLKRIDAFSEDSRISLRAEVPSSNVSLSIYLGPIDYFILKDLGYGLASVYSFGFALFSPFARAILYLFHFFQGFIGNYGVIIIILALLMKIVFWPFTIKSLKSMRKMQELKPKMDALRKLYKDDPQRLQKEMMELYKQYKVNPFSGCLILILQLPIFWALYQILQNTIELRGAPFILWIKDLSVRDPYYVLPILMGGTSLLQALMQPAQDQQSRLFGLFMPIFLTVIFLKFPSGIVLYWLTYSALSVLEQLWLRRT